jgi:hypothetical protein
MQKTESRITERIPYNTEKTPLVHRIATRVGVMLTHLLAVWRGSLVISGGTSNGTSLAENPGGLAAQTFKIEGNSGNSAYPHGTLKNITARTLIRRRIIDEGRLVSDLVNGASGINGAAGTYTVNMPFWLRFALPILRRPFDTALDTGMFTDLRLTILNGAASLQYSGNDRAFNYAGVSWDIYEKFEAFRGAGNGPIAVLFDTDVQRNLSGANTRLQVNKEIPVDGAYLDILWMAQTTNNALADTIVNQIALQAGTEEFYNRYQDSIRDDMQDVLWDPNTALTGLYWTPCIEDGLLTSAKNEVQAIIDQNNPGTDNLLFAMRRVQMIPQQFLQQGKKAA